MSAPIEIAPGAAIDDPALNSGCVVATDGEEMLGVWYWRDRATLVAFLFDHDPYRVEAALDRRQYRCERHTGAESDDRGREAPKDLNGGTDA